MTKIRPFAAVIYNQEKIKDLSSVVCPPYDIIPEDRKQYYYDKSPYNLIHILLGKDIPNENKYARSAVYFEEWLRNEIFIQNSAPAIYFYSQQYVVRGEKKTRIGFIALLHLGNQNKTSAFSHEHTRLEAKEDRFRLLEQVKANLSPIFVIFSDKKRLIQRIFQQYITGTPPFINITDDEKIIHKVWKLDSPDVLKKIQTNMQNTDVFIADGHHRYEVACAYRDQMRKKIKEGMNEENDFNYILAYFTNMDARDLSILPIHRLFKPDTNIDSDDLLLKIKAYFDIEEIKDRNRLFFLMEKGAIGQHLLGMYKNKKYWLLRLENIKILNTQIADRAKVFRSLDVCILNSVILKNILGVDLEDKEKFIFSANAEEFIEQANKNPSYVVFFLNAAKVKQIISVALIGEKMPAKSTYFYPKVLSGLVINRLKEE